MRTKHSVSDARKPRNEEFEDLELALAHKEFYEKRITFEEYFNNLTHLVIAPFEHLNGQMLKFRWISGAISKPN